MHRPLLYVHPYGHVLDELVPMGAVALMNRVEGDKLGRFAWELTEAEIVGAGCVAMDLHWYFSIEAVRWIAADIRRLAPELPIVLGGITASFYARHLLAEFPVDYIVQGDAEESFPLLVEALCAGRVPPALPNVWTRSGPPPALRAVPAELYDGNDYLDLSWFPSLQARTAAAHRRYAAAPFWGEMDRYHPYVPLNRGCRFPCGVCFGSWQREVFGAGQVDRSALALGRFLDGAEAHPDYRFVNLTAGTEDMARVRAYRDVLARRRPLGAYLMHFCSLPGDAELQILLDGFERLCIDFTNPADVPLPLRAAGFSEAAAQERILEICAALDGEERVRVGVSFLSTAPSPFKDRLRARSWARVELKENSEWALPRPDLRTLGEGLAPDDIDQLPAWPIPEVDRRGLSPAQRQVREQAKAVQAEGFRAVSRDHAHYLLARAISPALHPLLDQSLLQQVDGQALHRVRPGPAQHWLEAYRTRFLRQHVTTLHAVDLVLAATGDPVPAAGLQAVSTWSPDLGRAQVVAAFDGLRLSWEGPVPGGATGLVLRALPAAEEGLVLDPKAIPGLRHLVLPLRGQAHVRVDGCVSAHACRLSVDGGPPFTWEASAMRPPTPFDPPADAPAENGPTDAVTTPWPDEAPARRWGQALARAEAQGRLGAWTGVEIEASPRWLLRELVHADGARVRVFVLPAGEGPCAHASPLARLLVQEGEPGGTAEATRWALMTALKALIDAGP